MPDPLPEPLTPPDCDLRGLPWIPIGVADLRDGELARVLDAEAFRGGVLALAAAWQQVPAASLPDDDAAIAYLTGYGRDIVTWQRARGAGALVGWVLCADLRIYHPQLAERARDAWTSRQKRRAAGEKGNAKRWNDRGEATQSAPASQCDRNAMPERSQSGRRREKEGEREEIEKKGSLRSPLATAAETSAFADWWAEYPRGVAPVKPDTRLVAICLE